MLLVKCKLLVFGRYKLKTDSEIRQVKFGPIWQKLQNTCGNILLFMDRFEVSFSVWTEVRIILKS